MEGKITKDGVQDTLGLIICVNIEITWDCDTTVVMSGGKLGSGVLKNACFEG